MSAPALSSSSIRVVLKKASQVISLKDAEWLMESLLSRTRAEIYLAADAALSSEVRAKYYRWVRARKAGRPLQYIVRRAPFYGYDFFVNKSVLIPRPETEILVERVLVEAKKIAVKLDRPIKILDIGTGSGAIAITLKLEMPSCEIVGTDISAAALTVARKNAVLLGAEVKFFKSDLLKKFRAQEFDLIVSNPPYLNRKLDKVTKEVLAWEPHLALFPGKNCDGGELAERIIQEAYSVLKNPPKVVLLELTPRVVTKLAGKYGKRGVAEAEIFSDLTGRKRFLTMKYIFSKNRSS